MLTIATTVIKLAAAVTAAVVGFVAISDARISDADGRLTQHGRRMRRYFFAASTVAIATIVAESIQNAFESARATQRYVDATRRDSVNIQNLQELLAGNSRLVRGLTQLDSLSALQLSESRVRDSLSLLALRNLLSSTKSASDVVGALSASADSTLKLMSSTVQMQTRLVSEQQRTSREVMRTRYPLNFHGIGITFRYDLDDPSLRPMADSVAQLAERVARLVSRPIDLRQRNQVGDVEYRRRTHATRGHDEVSAHWNGYVLEFVLRVEEPGGTLELQRAWVPRHLLQMVSALGEAPRVDVHFVPVISQDTATGDNRTLAALSLTLAESEYSLSYAFLFDYRTGRMVEGTTLHGVTTNRDDMRIQSLLDLPGAEVLVRAPAMPAALPTSLELVVIMGPHLGRIIQLSPERWRREACATVCYRTAFAWSDIEVVPGEFRSLMPPME